MALPHLLLVDDSEAILAFEAAALSSHYQITTAANDQHAAARSHRVSAIAEDAQRGGIVPVVDDVLHQVAAGAFGHGFKEVAALRLASLGDRWVADEAGFCGVRDDPGIVGLRQHDPPGSGPGPFPDPLQG